MSSEHPALAWQLRLLGGFALERGGQRIARLHSRAAVALLARLALRPQRDHAREELAAWLWPEADLVTGLARLRQTLSTLKGLLERSAAPGAGQTVIEANRQVLRLVPGALLCDAVQFEAAIAGRDRAAAARLYGGELLPGHYDDWIATERLRLQALADAAGVGAADLAAVATLQPAPALRASASPGAAPTPSALRHDDGLPHYLTAPVGGQAPVAALAAQVAQSRLVTVRGTGGLGKTRLAVAAARQLLTEGRVDTARFVPWAGCVSWPQAAQRLAQALGQPASLAEDLLGETVRALAGRRSLLVLDNCEQCDNEVLALVPSLLARLPDLHLLLTSRRTLGLAGELDWQPEALACPPEPAALEAIAPTNAVQLFVERARASRADFMLNAGNAGAVARVTRALGGLPLAIELAAASVRTLPPARLAALLEAGGAERWRLLGRRGPAGATEPRHASMAVVIEASLGWISPPARALLDRLALVPAAVCGALVAAGQETAAACQALASLAELADGSLLTPAGDDTLDRWWSVPEPVRDLLLEQLPSARHPPALATWRRALLAWLPGLAPDWPLPTVERVLPLISAVLQPAADPPPGEVLALLCALEPVWQEKRPPDNLRLALERALADLATPDGPAAVVGPDLMQRARALAADLAFAAGQRRQAREHAAWLAAQLPASPATQAQVALAQARVAWRVDADAVAAHAALRRAAAADHRPAARALQLRQAATIAFEADRDTAGSEQLLQQALRLLHGDAQVSRHLLRALRYNLAIAAVHDGRPAEALPLLDALVDEAAAAGHARLRSDALNSRGSAHQALGRRDAAEADTRAALAEAWGRLETESALYALWNLGLMAGERGDAERAARLMAFADRFWRTHFGSLAASDARDVARLRRQCRQRLGRASGQRCWEEGAALPLAAAVALALA